MKIKPHIATLRGTLLTPGVSKNNRLYTKEMIAKAAQRMQERIAGKGLPITSLTHHEAADDSLKIVAKVTKVEVRPDGSATYEAKVPDTAAGHDIVALTMGDDPYLKNVSIRGSWLGDVRSVRLGETDAETADDLDIDGIDFTKDPGVSGAELHSVDLAESATRDNRMIYESAPISVEVRERDYSKDERIAMAKKGYAVPQKNSKGEIVNGSYPIADKEDLDNAKHAFGRNPSPAVKAHINKRAKALGEPLMGEEDDKKESAMAKAKVTEEVAPTEELGVDPVAVPEAEPEADETEPAEETSVEDEPAKEEGTTESAPKPSVMESSPQLKAAGHTPMGHVAVDPDGDGDVDGYACMTCGHYTPETDPALNPDYDEDSMGDGDTETEPKPKETAKATKATVTEAAPTAATPEVIRVIAETMAKAVSTMKGELRAEIIKEYGLPPRKGLVKESVTITKPLHEMNPEEWHQYVQENAGLFIPGSVGNR